LRPTMGERLASLAPWLRTIPLLILAVSLVTVTSVLADVTTDQADYAPGSVVTISGDNSDGAGYLPGETVHVDVSGPNGYTASCEATADDAGAWSCQVTLWDSELAEGDYTYTATGLTSGVSESGTFTDHGPSPVTASTYSITANASHLISLSVVLGGGSSTVTLTAATMKVANVTLATAFDVTLGGPGGNGNGTWSASFQGACVTTYKINNVMVTWTTTHDHVKTETPGTVEVTTGACAPANTAPTADAGGPYTGDEGSEIELDGTGSSDSDGTIASYSWTVMPQSAGANDPDTGAGCTVDTTVNGTPSMPKVTCTDDGIYDVMLTVTDDDGASDDDATTLTLDNVAPAFDSGKPAFAATNVNCSNNIVTLNFAFTDAGSNDTHTATIDWGDGSAVQNLNGTEAAAESATHTYNSGGPYTAVVNVTDDDLGSSGAVSSSNMLIVNYNMSNILQPINDTRNGQVPSLFKYGSTFPVKVEIKDCGDNHPSSLAVTVRYAKIAAATPPGTDEAVSNSAADTGNYMRFSYPIYIYNMNSRLITDDPTSAITIFVKIVATGQTKDASIGLRK